MARCRILNMKVYHYTDASFAESIEKIGLEPTEITTILELIGEKGIWVFDGRPQSKIEEAFVLRQMTKFGCSTVILYEINIDGYDLELKGYSWVTGIHSTIIEERKYESEIRILPNVIPPESLKVIGTFSLDFKNAIR